MMRRDAFMAAILATPLALVGSGVALLSGHYYRPFWGLAWGFGTAFAIWGAAVVEVFLWRYMTRRVYARTGRVMLSPIITTEQDSQLEAARFRLSLGPDALDAVIFLGQHVGDSGTVRICVAPAAPEIDLARVITTDGTARVTYTDEGERQLFSVEVTDIRDYLNRERFRICWELLRKRPILKEDA